MARPARIPPTPTHPARVVTAGAAQVKKIKNKVVGISREDWKEDAWVVYDTIGEIKQSVNFLANVCAGVRLFIAVRPTGDEVDIRPADSNDVGFAEADDVLRRIDEGSAQDGLGGFIQESVVNLKITGDMFVMADPGKEANPVGATYAERVGVKECWSVLSVSEVKAAGSKAEIIHAPGQKPRKVEVPEADEDIDLTKDQVFLLRVWQRHPRFGALADCMMRALLTECDELILLSRAIRGAARSRLAQNGMLLVANEYSFANADQATNGDEVEDPEVDPFLRRFAAAIMEAIEDETSPEGVVPPVVRADASVIRDAPITHVGWENKLDTVAPGLRTELLARIGSSVDLPWEQVTGMGAANHWSAWQVDTATWGRYGHPTMRTLVNAWTEGILMPFLDMVGVAPEAAKNLMIWFDPADAIVDPDESKTADEGFDRGYLSWEAYGRRKGFNDDERATDEELAQRATLGLLKGGGSAAAGGQAQGTAENTAPNGGSQTAALVAARPRSLGRQLGEIDHALRVRLTTIADTALTRALEKAGARVRTASRRDKSMAAALATVPAFKVCAHVGPSAVAAVGLSDDQLLQDGFDGSDQRIDTAIRNSQAATRRALRRRFNMSDHDVEGLQARQDRERAAAVTWFMAGLLSLAHDRLYNPAPVAPARGEFDVSTQVPATMIREVMVRAGGGATPDGQPDGGVATGVDVMAIWAANGLTVDGYEWIHGDPSNPLEGHELLEGQTFNGWDDPVLAILPGDEWLGRDFYQPSDHEGCTCDFAPLEGEETADA